MELLYKDGGVDIRPTPEPEDIEQDGILLRAETIKKENGNATNRIEAGETVTVELEAVVDLAANFRMYFLGIGKVIRVVSYEAHNDGRVTLVVRNSGSRPVWVAPGTDHIAKLLVFPR